MDAGIIQALCLADDQERCPAPGCRVSPLGHLLEHLTPEQVARVRELDPTQPT